MKSVIKWIGIILLAYVGFKIFSNMNFEVKFFIMLMIFAYIIEAEISKLKDKIIDLEYRINKKDY